MGTLTDKITSDIKTAMLEKSEFRLSVLRMVKADLLNNLKSEKQEPEVEIILGYHKKLGKSMEMYASNPEHLKRIESEMKIVEEYLPQKWSEAELKAHVQKHASLGNMGTIMKALKADAEAEAKLYDGKMASELVKKVLAG